MGRRRVDLQEAAKLLGISSDAVRKRAKRGTMAYETGVDGKLYVWVDQGETSGETGDYPGGVADERQGDARGDRELLIEELLDQVAFLRRELQARTEEARRKDTIIMSLAQRVPELEPPRDEPHAPETVSETTEGTDTPGREQAETGVQRRSSWWRRFFGFEDRGSG